MAINLLPPSDCAKPRAPLPYRSRPIEVGGILRLDATASLPLAICVLSVTAR